MRIKLIVFMAMSIAVNQYLLAKDIELSNETMRIVFGSQDEGFSVKSIEPLESPGVKFLSPDGKKADLFDLAFIRPSDGQWPFHATNRSRAQSKRMEKTATGIRFVFDGVTIHGDKDVLDVVCEITMLPRTSNWSIYVKNRSARYALLRTDYPILRGVVPDGEGDVLAAYRNQGGIVVPKCDLTRKVPEFQMRQGYPGCRMPIAAFHKNGAGLSFAAHDGAAKVKTLCFAPGIDIHLETPAENAGVLGKAENAMDFTVEIACYKGDWWKAAKLYRDWAVGQKWCAKGKIATRRDYPRKAAESHLWVIGGGVPSGRWNSASNILERMHLLWPDVGKCMEWSGMADKVKNQFDPESFYIKSGVRQVAEFGRGLGIMVMPYINGRLWDTNLVSYAYAKKDACLRRDGSVAVENYDGVDFAVMCPTRPVWQEILHGKARDAIEAHGADAVYLDQIACSIPPPWTCYNHNHDHALGGGTWWEEGYRKLLTAIRADFASHGAAITSEQMGETWIDLIDHFLDATPRSPYDVPLFAAVYSGYALSHGARADVNLDAAAYFRENARTVLYGQALGWIHVGVVLHERNLPQAETLYRIAKARKSAADFLVYGTLEGELESRPSNSGVIGTWWKNAGGTSVALALANSADEMRSVKVKLPEGVDMMVPRVLDGHKAAVVKCTGGIMAVSIPPRSMALLESR